MDYNHGHDTFQRTASNTKLYADACREVGAELGVTVVDIWTAFMTSVGWEEGKPLDGSKDVPRNPDLENLLSDGMFSPAAVMKNVQSSATNLPPGLHFKPGGYKIMYDEVIRNIRKNCPELAPENMPMVLPAWEVAPW
jgi:hypothetical protein